MVGRPSPNAWPAIIELELSLLEVKMLDERARKLAQGPNFASLATIMPDGTLQVHVMWVDADEEHILINTEVHRRKFKNMMANPTVTVLIVHRNDPWSYVEVRGEVTDTVTGPVARSHIDALSHKYLAVDEYPRPITSERVICKITPTRIVKFPPS